MAVVATQALASGEAGHAGHGAGLGRHLVHHVVRQMAVQHPVAGIVRDELNGAALRNADEHCVAGPPGGLRDAAAFGSGDVEGVSMEVHGVVVHAEVDEPDADALALAHDQRRRRRAGFSVEQKPVELHHLGVGRGRVRQHGVLLQVDEEVLLAVRAVGCAGMHDEGAEHAGELLHGHVRVVEEGAFLVDDEVVRKALAGADRLLADAGHAVVADGIFEAVPVHGGRLGQLVLEDDADLVALRDLDGGAGRGAVIAPDVDGLVRRDLLLEDVRDEAEDLGVSVHLKRQITDVCGDDRRGSDRAGVGVYLRERAAADAGVASPCSYLG